MPIPGRFPVGASASYTDDWHAPRSTPRFHLHQGTDIFAPEGTPVLAPAGGTVRVSHGRVGGLAVYVDQRDGTFFYLAHLSGLADVAPGQSVATGEVVGYVGTSGNARGGKPHLHFEIHPQGGRAINPKPILDQWSDDVPELIPFRAPCANRHGSGASLSQSTGRGAPGGMTTVARSDAALARFRAARPARSLSPIPAKSEALRRPATSSTARLIMVFLAGYAGFVALANRLRRRS